MTPTTRCLVTGTRGRSKLSTKPPPKQQRVKGVVCLPRIPDPAASKPDDWDEDAPAKIPDPDATKPDGWLDEGPEFIADPDAKAPEDWSV